MASEGRVVRVDAKRCHVEVDGEVRLCALRGSLFGRHPEEKRPVAVGDRVRVELGEDPGAIVERLPRTTKLSRVSAGEIPREQVIVANVDLALVVASPRLPPFSSTHVDRILAAAARGGIEASLCLNKTDLARGKRLDRIEATYREAGYEVMRTSAKKGRGLEALRERLRGRVTVLCGLSGVGKSSLLNAFQPGLRLRVGDISGKWRQGRHTTAFVNLLRLEFGGWVVDTPGLRGFDLWRVEPSELRHLYPEFARFEAGCRYPDCRHAREPGCAVPEAVKEGKLAPSRHASYLEILEELEERSREESVEGTREGKAIPRRERVARIEADDLEP